MFVNTSMSIFPNVDFTLQFSLSSTHRSSRYRFLGHSKLSFWKTFRRKIFKKLCFFFLYCEDKEPLFLACPFSLTSSFVYATLAPKQQWTSGRQYQNSVKLAFLAGLFKYVQTKVHIDSPITLRTRAIKWHFLEFY